MDKLAAPTTSHYKNLAKRIHVSGICVVVPHNHADHAAAPISVLPHGNFMGSIAKFAQRSVNLLNKLVSARLAETPPSPPPSPSPSPSPSARSTTADLLEPIPGTLDLLEPIPGTLQRLFELLCCKLAASGKECLFDFDAWKLPLEEQP